MAITQNEGSKKKVTTPLNTGVSGELPLIKNNIGEQNNSLLEDKANTILPLLNGLNMAQIEEILRLVGLYAKYIPIQYPLPQQ